MPSLDELLAHPERHTLAILALEEVLGGRVDGLPHGHPGRAL